MGLKWRAPRERFDPYVIDRVVHRLSAKVYPGGPGVSTQRDYYDWITLLRAASAAVATAQEVPAVDAAEEGEGLIDLAHGWGEGAFRFTTPEITDQPGVQAGLEIALREIEAALADPALRDALAQTLYLNCGVAWGMRYVPTEAVLRLLVGRTYVSPPVVQEYEPAPSAGAALPPQATCWHCGGQLIQFETRVVCPKCIVAINRGSEEGPAEAEPSHLDGPEASRPGV